MLAGNENWRSPEAHFKGELNEPTDIFSFVILVSVLEDVKEVSANLQSVYLRYAWTSYFWS